MRKRIWLTIGAVVVGLAVLAAFNHRSLVFAYAAATAEKRPALLADARWNDPASARKFNALFKPGSSQSNLLMWLKARSFEIDFANHAASRRVRSLPCNELVDVAWAPDPDDTLVHASATVREAGCL